jgi:hypothetical protein
MHLEGIGKPHASVSSIFEVIVMQNIDGRVSGDVNTFFERLTVLCCASEVAVRKNKLFDQGTSERTSAKTDAKIAMLCL